MEECCLSCGPQLWIYCEALREEVEEAIVLHSAFLRLEADCVLYAFKVIRVFGKCLFDLLKLFIAGYAPEECSELFAVIFSGHIELSDDTAKAPHVDF